jgi:hypothetical protein
MDISRLGPLEKSIIKALLRAESAGMPLSLPQIWRCLAGYSTHLSNVVGALAEDSPLASFLSEERDQYVLRDQRHLLTEFGPKRQRADVLWTDLQQPIEALCREPAICGLALTGSMAWGMPPAAGLGTELFVIAAPHSVAEAAEAVQRTAANLPPQRVLIAAEVVAIDELTLAPGSVGRALELLCLRPILSESAFMTLWEHNSWLVAAFPNFDLNSPVGGDVPDALLAEVLDDRRSALRRLLSRRARRFGGALRALGRRRGQRRAHGSSGTAGPQAAAASSAPLSSAQRQEALEQRWTTLQDWLFPDPPPEAPQAAAPPPPEIAQAEPAPAVEEPTQSDGQANDSEGNPGSSRRRSRRTRAPRQVRAVASAERGQRSRGRGRSRGKGRRGGRVA